MKSFCTSALATAALVVPLALTMSIAARAEEAAPAPSLQMQRQFEIEMPKKPAYDPSTDDGAAANDGGLEATPSNGSQPDLPPCRPAEANWAV